MKHVQRSTCPIDRLLVNIDPETAIFNDKKTKFYMNLLDLDMDIIDQVIIVIPNEYCFAIANGKV